MAIKNYTSEVPVGRSISNIEHRLAQAGVSHIGKSYDKDQRPIGMIFQININGTPQGFKLPAKADKVYNWFLLQRKRTPTQAQKEQIRKQADKTAWKILYDWIDVQVSLIELEQAEPAEVFFPYLYDFNSNMTIYEIAKENKFKQLTQ